MPIVSIELLQDSVGAERVPEATVRALADGLGALFGSKPAGTWVKISYLDRGSYAENHAQNAEENGLPPDVRPVFIQVIKGELQPEAELRDEAKRVCELVAGLLQRPAENTHVIYEPPAAGRIAFGGKLVPGPSD